MKTEYVIKKAIISVFFFIEFISILISIISLKGISIIPSSYDFIFTYFYIITGYILLRMLAYIYQTIKVSDYKGESLKEYINFIDQQGKYIKKILSNLNIIIITSLSFSLFSFNTITTWEKNILYIFLVDVFMLVISFVSFILTLKKLKTLNQKKDL